MCTLSAITDASGKVILQNPKPGTRGNLGQSVIEQPGTWTFDAGMGKRFKISESKGFTFRMDATNVFNHPTPADPIGLANQSTSTSNSFNDANGNTFGQIINKTGSRTFQGKLRFSF